mgnify:CR=1 FL=1
MTFLSIISQMLDLYHGVLTTQMKKIGLKDPEIWIYQPEALADEKEMVEVRHRLNDRRGKLREKMEYNQEIIMTYGKELYTVSRYDSFQLHLPHDILISYSQLYLKN